MRLVMPVFFSAVPSGLAAIHHQIDSPGGNYQLAGLSFTQLEKQSYGSYLNH